MKLRRPLRTDPRAPWIVIDAAGAPVANCITAKGTSGAWVATAEALVEAVNGKPTERARDRIERD